MSTPDAAIVLWYTPPEFTYAFFWSNVDNLYVSVHAAAGRRDPPIGPSVDDLVTALSTQPEFEATAPVDVTVGSFSGKRIELTALDPVPTARQPIRSPPAPRVRPWSPGRRAHEHLDSKGSGLSCCPRRP